MYFMHLVLSIMLAVCAYYAGIMLNAFATYHAHNYCMSCYEQTILLPSECWLPLHSLSE